MVIVCGVLTGLNKGAFRDCTMLGEVQLGTTLTSMEAYAFANCSALQKFNSQIKGQFIIPDTVTSIGTGAFKGCNAITDITLPFVGNKIDSSKTFGYIFGAGGSGSKTSGDGSTYQNGNHYYIPQSIRKVTITMQTVIPYNAFYNCDLIEEINIPSNATSIVSYAFYECNALSRLNSNTDGTFNIPSGVTEIQERSFYNNKLLKTLNVGDISTIGEYAFSGCSMLEKFETQTLKTIKESAFV